LSDKAIQAKSFVAIEPLMDSLARNIKILGNSRNFALFVNDLN
jgi:hypothetical protein